MYFLNFKLFAFFHFESNSRINAIIRNWALADLLIFWNAQEHCAFPKICTFFIESLLINIKAIKLIWLYYNARQKKWEKQGFIFLIKKHRKKDLFKKFFLLNLTRRLALLKKASKIPMAINLISINIETILSEHQESSSCFVHGIL